MTEDQLERDTLAWLQDVGYTHRYQAWAKGSMGLNQKQVVRLSDRSNADL